MRRDWFHHSDSVLQKPNRTLLIYIPLQVRIMGLLKQTLVSILKTMTKNRKPQNPFFLDFIIKLKLISGLGLVFFVTTHLLNHSLGIFGLHTIEKGQTIFLGFWRSQPFYWAGGIILATHLITTFWFLFKKKTYRGIPYKEWLRLILGFCIPYFLIGHIVATRGVHHLYGIKDSYSFFLFQNYPYFFPYLIVMAVFAWLHGIIGLYIYLNTKKWFYKIKYGLFTIALVLPIVAVWGIQKVGDKVNQKKKTDSSWVQYIEDVSNPDKINYSAQVVRISDPITHFYFPVLLFLLLTRGVAFSVFRRKKTIKISYLDGKKVPIPKGTSLLETSLMSNIPHAHICGGRGRCTTCRSLIIDGYDQLPLPSMEEKRVLKNIDAEPNVRLACQTKPTSDCLIHPILPPDITIDEIFFNKMASPGSDKEIAILFSDIRKFTSLAEKKTPYDVVFILNKYIQSMGDAIYQNDGYINKFAGDGIMALFGLNQNIKQGCQSAIKTAKMMDEKLKVLNEQLKTELENPITIGIGIHCGHVVVGDMGYKTNRHLTAIGDPVNTASRLEDLTKKYKCKLIVSSAVAEQASLNQDNFEKTQIDVRGKTESLTIYCINSFEELFFE